MISMTTKEFKQYVMRYGANLDAWPASQQAAARRRLLQSPELACLLAEEARLAKLLDKAAAAPEAPPGMAARIVNAALTRPQKKGVGQTASEFFLDLLKEFLPVGPAYALSVALAAGIVFGLASANLSQVESTAATTDTTLSAFVHYQGEIL